MTLVLGAFGLRFLIYSVLTNPWHILPVELLQGICFGIFWSTMASYAYVVSPEGSAATVQGIVSAAFKGIGEIIDDLILRHEIVHYKIVNIFRLQELEGAVLLEVFYSRHYQEEWPLEYLEWLPLLFVYCIMESCTFFSITFHQCLKFLVSKAKML